MKINIFLFSIALIFLFSSCGKKQEEVKINRIIPVDTVKSGNEIKKDSSDTQKNEAGSETDKVYTTTEAKSHTGENAVVKGYVADVVIRDKVAYLNFDKKYPRNTFSGVIFSDSFSKVGDLDIYKNKNVELKGTITQYKDKPQIIINSKNQIKILK